MASTYTDLGLELMATGENAGTWGTKTNANLSLVEQLTGGHLSVSIAGGAGSTDLDIDNGALTGTAQQRVIELTGTISGNRIVTFPVLTENFYFIKNGTTGGHTVQLKAATGSGATVTYSTTDKGWKIIYLDGVATNTGLYQLNDNLSGLKVGTDVQAYDAGLAAIAGLAVTDGNIIVGNGSTFVAENGATARTSLGVAIGSDVQAFDAQLTDVAGLAVTNGGFIVGDGSNFVLETGATARTSIGLGTADNVEFEDTQVDSFGVGTAPSGTTGEIRATNDITAFYSSDVALKENIVNIPDPIEAIKKLNGVLFDWKKEYMDERGGEDGYFVRKKDVGVIAQEVEKVLPEAVAQRPDGVKAVKYDRLTCLLIEAVKKLSAQVDSLTNKES
tara:strand:- start:8554 stop:9720 length:1167 start_codon:yes stop_codon:yes gene_type:complete